MVAGPPANVTALGNNLAGTVNPLSFFSNNNPVNAGNNVKAGLCYIIFDDQFKFLSGGFDPVNTATSGGIKPHILQNIPIPKNGYIYIYCSNESNINVFFDNLEIVHTRGQILEESHFYALGMRMEGICSKAANKICNKYQYNGKELQSQEFSDGSGLEEYDYGARFFDPQLGVWHNPDPLADISRRYSPYVYALNNPIRFIDPDGMEAVGADGLTNDQWVKSSRPGADANSARNFREENRNEKKKREGKNNNDEDKIVNFKRELNTTSGEIHDIETGDAPKGSQTGYTDLTGGGYKEENIFYNFTQAAFLPVENIGFTGSFNIKGYIQISQQFYYGKFIKWFATVSAIGSTPASFQGDVSFYGKAQLMIGANVVASESFHLAGGPMLKEQNTFPIGTATFLLPNVNSIVQIKISAGYIFQNEQGGAVPVPGLLNKVIKISH